MHKQLTHKKRKLYRSKIKGEDSRRNRDRG